MTRGWPMLAALLCVMIGCGDDGGGDGAQRVCPGGSTEGCVCIGGGFGTRLCSADGSRWSSCFCSSADSGTAQVCSPGVAYDCACPGESGTQICRSDGAGFGACVCPTVDAGRPDVPMRNCSGRECGPDGVGGVCGNCPLSGWTCNLGSGRCVPPDMTCRSACSGRVCGADPGMHCEGRTCGTCTGNATCTTAGQCVCTPRCSGRVCGDNGCGGTCGTCPVGSQCTSAGQCSATSTCISACGGRLCGPDTGPGCSGRTCGACPSGYACNSSGSACNLNPNSNWQITAVSGTVGNSPGGGAWDADGSAPDPRFCMSFTDGLRCTEEATNTFTPRWTMNQFPAFPASFLTTPLTVAYEDVDSAFNDPICASGSTITFMPSQIFNGSEVTFTCGNVGSFTLRLSPAP